MTAPVIALADGVLVGFLHRAPALRLLALAAALGAGQPLKLVAQPRAEREVRALLLLRRRLARLDQRQHRARADLLDQDFVCERSPLDQAIGLEFLDRAAA